MTAIDLSSEMVRYCRDVGLNARVMDFLSLQFPAGSFDAVYAMNCLLHDPSADFRSVLSYIRQFIRPQGMFPLEQYGGEDQGGIRERDYTGPPRFFCHNSDDRLLSLVSGLLEVVSFEQVDIGSKTLFTPISSRSPCGEPTNLPRSLPARSAFQRSQRHCPADDANTRDGAQTLEQGHPVPANGYQGPERVQQVCDRVERGND